MCVLCVQWIAGWQNALMDPSISERYRARLEELVQQYKGRIQDSNSHIAQLDYQIAELMKERSAKGELPGCHANGSR